MVRNNFRAKGL